MKTVQKFGCLAYACGMATLAHAQFVQPYDKPLDSFESVVRSCLNPAPAPRACADDFRFADNFQVNHLRWWGVVSSTQQLAKPYYVAIYLDNNCKPGRKMWDACVVPRTKFFAVDCEGVDVYVFNVALPAPLNIPPGHYWFRVAESDQDSVVPGKTDFMWSGRRPIQGCKAGYHQLLPVKGWVRPLIDLCDNLQDDLAFCVLG